MLTISNGNMRHCHIVFYTHICTYIQKAKNFILKSQTNIECNHLKWCTMAMTYWDNARKNESMRCLAYRHRRKRCNIIGFALQMTNNIHLTIFLLLLIISSSSQECSYLYVHEREYVCSTPATIIFSSTIYNLQLAKKKKIGFW